MPTNQMAIDIKTKLFNTLQKKETILLTLIIILASFTRFDNLGYSSFYGDETKVLYTRKDVSAKDFLLNQRKGPLQFVAAWGMEKITGTHDEFSTRLPFAVASVVSVLILYFIVLLLFDKKAALIASFLYSINGFYIAFGRTVQYQSLLLFFGLLSILCVLLYVTNYKQSLKLGRFHLVIGGVSLGLSLLAHWDGIFFALVSGLFLLNYSYKSPKQLVFIAHYFVIPLLITLGIYYVPYFSGNYYAQHFVGYITRRVSGSQQLPSNSSFTFNLYNPSILFYLPFLFSFFVYKDYKLGIQFKYVVLLIWFFVPFIFFHFFFSNPGTHIHNYVLPLIIISSIGLSMVYDLFSKELKRHLFTGYLVGLFALLFIINASVFVPRFNMGYAWKITEGRSLYLKGLQKRTTQFFVYGFPYNRGWDQIRTYAKEENVGIRSFYTNDNVQVAEYYLQGIDVHPIHPDQMPQYYIAVENNQEFAMKPEIVDGMYVLIKEIYTEGTVTARIFKIKAQP